MVGGERISLCPSEHRSLRHLICPEVGIARSLVCLLCAFLKCQAGSIWLDRDARSFGSQFSCWSKQCPRPMDSALAAIRKRESSSVIKTVSAHSASGWIGLATAKPLPSVGCSMVGTGSRSAAAALFDQQSATVGRVIFFSRYRKPKRRRPLFPMP